MLQAYVDDSGSDPSDQVFVLAGVVSTQPSWKQFSEEWTTLCNEEPKTPDFHMSRANRLRGSYWGEGPTDQLKARRDAKLLALATIIAKHGLLKVHSAITWDGYRSAARHRVPAEIDHPYFFLFWRIIQAVVRWQTEIGLCEPVDFIFDDQNDLGRRAAGWYRYFVDALNEHERTIVHQKPTFCHDHWLPPLKAADMCAWCLRREVVDNLDSVRRQEQYVRPAAMNVLWSMPYAALHISASDVIEIASAVSRAGRRDADSS